MTATGDRAVEEAATGSLEFKTGLGRPKPNHLRTDKRPKIQMLRGKRVGKLQGITLCLLVRQDSVRPLYLPLQQLRGGDLAGLLDGGHSSHFSLGA